MGPLYWMQTDGPLRTRVYGDMRFRPISGTTGRRRYAIVVDVPRDSEAINFGVMGQGTGTIWMAHGSFTPVGKSVPTT